MSNQQSPQAPNMQQLPQMIAQYQQNIEYLNTNIATLRRNLERTDISPEERDTYRKQEQDLQSKLALYQTLINNLTPQMVAQNIQQRVIQQQMSPSSDSTPNSPANFNQQQQQLANFANNPAAQQQLRNVQAQQQAQQMNKMGLAVQQQQQMQQIQTSPIGAKPLVTNAQQQQAQAAVQAAAQAAVKNNNTGMFTFPSNSQPATPTTMQPPQTPSAPKPSTAPTLDNDGVNRVLTKRKIQELVSQIDPTERLEPEVEDILLEIADEFIESVTTFACQLAKHRKSDTLEVKDVQLHLERNWNIRIPGFASDDIRPLRKPTIPSSHQTKLQAVNAAKSQLNSSANKDTSHQ